MAAIFPNKGTMTIPSKAQVKGELLCAPPVKRRRKTAVKQTAKVVQKQPKSQPAKQIVKKPVRVYK